MEARKNRTTRWSELEWGRMAARAKCLGLSPSAYLRQLAARDVEQAERDAGAALCRAEGGQ